jgi:carotenoid cleavage dioxygenase-like enzyme
VVNVASTNTVIDPSTAATTVRRAWRGDMRSAYASAHISVDPAQILRYHAQAKVHNLNSLD